jgi:hypothetical protein
MSLQLPPLALFQTMAVLLAKGKNAFPKSAKMVSAFFINVYTPRNRRAANSNLFIARMQWQNELIYIFFNSILHEFLTGLGKQGICQFGRKLSAVF